MYYVQHRLALPEAYKTLFVFGCSAETKRVDVGIWNVPCICGAQRARG